MKTTKKHISLIKCGDIIIHNGKMVTVGAEYIKRGFMGITLYGDSYKAGTVPVDVVTL